MHSLQSWYRQYRLRGELAVRALYLARIMADVEKDIEATLGQLTRASRNRVETFVDGFIRGSEVEYLTSDRDSDFTNERERANRCYDAAEFGCDGKTHSEVINDWRDAFNSWVHNRRSGKYGLDPDRFTNAVLARFMVTEIWHEYNGSSFPGDWITCLDSLSISMANSQASSRTNA